MLLQKNMRWRFGMMGPKGDGYPLLHNLRYSHLDVASPATLPYPSFWPWRITVPERRGFSFEGYKFTTARLSA